MKYFAIFVICLLFAFPCFAEEAQIEGVADEVLEEPVGLEYTGVTFEEIEVEIEKDTEVSAGDLGVREPTILPDSPFYFFKELRRAFERTFTFGAVKKAEIELHQANEKIIEARELLKKKGERGSEKAVQAIEQAQERINKIANRAEKLKEKIGDDASVVDKFLDKLADREIKTQKILQKLEEQVPEQAFLRIREARENSMEKFGEVMEKVSEKHSEIRQRLERVIDEQKGGEFKEFKNLEILKEIKERMPEGIKDDFKSAEDSQLMRLKEKAIKSQEKFKRYAEDIKGNAGFQAEILGQFREGDGEAETFNGAIEERILELKNKALEQKNRLQRIEGQSEAPKPFFAPVPEPENRGVETKKRRIEVAPDISPPAIDWNDPFYAPKAEIEGGTDAPKAEVESGVNVPKVEVETAPKAIPLPKAVIEPKRSGNEKN